MACRSKSGGICSNYHQVGLCLLISRCLKGAIKRKPFMSRRLSRISIIFALFCFVVAQFNAGTRIEGTAQDRMQAKGEQVVKGS